MRLTGKKPARASAGVEAGFAPRSHHNPEAMKHSRKRQVSLGDHGTAEEGRMRPGGRGA